MFSDQRTLQISITPLRPGATGIGFLPVCYWGLFMTRGQRKSVTGGRPSWQEEGLAGRRQKDFHLEMEENDYQIPWAPDRRRAAGDHWVQLLPSRRFLNLVSHWDYMRGPVPQPLLLVPLPPFLFSVVSTHLHLSPSVATVGKGFMRLSIVRSNVCCLCSFQNVFHCVPHSKS